MDTKRPRKEGGLVVTLHATVAAELAEAEANKRRMKDAHVEAAQREATARDATLVAQHESLAADVKVEQIRLQKRLADEMRLTEALPAHGCFSVLRGCSGDCVNTVRSELVGCFRDYHKAELCLLRAVHKGMGGVKCSFQSPSQWLWSLRRRYKEVHSTTPRVLSGDAQCAGCTELLRYEEGDRGQKESWVLVRMIPQ
jgi:hypothetical protein